MLRNKLFFVFIFILLAAAFTYGQAEGKQFRIHGRVLDQNKAVVAGAKVTATAKEGGSALSAVTDQNGEFTFNVAPGEYKVTVEAKYFEQAPQSVDARQSDADSLEIMLYVKPSVDTVEIVDTSNYRVDSINSATKTNVPLRDVPQSITVVTKEQIKDQMMTSISYVIRYTPAIASHQGENNRDQLIIRGQSTSADFFRDGLRDDVQY